MSNKPWLKKKDERVINVMGAEITLKKISFGDSRNAIQQAFQVDPFTKKSTVDATLLGVLRALYQIKDWNLTDEEGNKLPITLDTFDNLLDEDFVSQIIKEVQEISDEVKAEEKK
ncbi:hypothetical protein BpsS36_00018 [Bacillus phage vB_BpsS-36]|uniref:Tail assembly chaperone n=1 Tax=Bacillus phage vB_BpsS-36 TaxID=2419622 RepID=A0A3G3BWZ6_9CAUD|nr:hypothetical protein BpsS36_00018 [Bacillus phage vB_BpsS-36]